LASFPPRRTVSFELQVKIQAPIYYPELNHYLSENFGLIDLAKGKHLDQQSYTLAQWRRGHNESSLFCRLWSGHLHSSKHASST